jgi:hypothetical protein
MDREDRHSRIDNVVAQWKSFGRAPDRRRNIGSPLGNHLLRRLDRDDIAVYRLIGTSARTNVDDALGISEGCLDAGRDAGLGLPRLGIATPDPGLSSSPPASIE